MVSANTVISGKPGFATALLLAAGMAVTVGSALGFEHIGGYIPCALCLLQRQPYYYGIPVALLAALNAALGGPAWLTRLLIALVGVMMIVGAGLGVYHSGVEWHFWEGPATCATSANGVTQDAGNLLDDLNKVKGPSCTEASLRVLGLSFAGWNVIASLILATIAFRGVATRRA
ncbi:disulfide bond formation protein B [Gellertiella hungarica]|uniref:Disulfide bond formation protein DsbB n=1 Tax=Gellertiella hungarica TaxID=1572859 RepID=A0A7W6J734_9HYPH|nr:disulfide bond formation protein B [Gellertiella hungarica]MBB4065103.1 disulfide bond formation protein DsbB [Gellertiella hungarica]